MADYLLFLLNKDKQMCNNMCKFMCERRECMPTNLAIDENLLKEAQKVGRHKTKKNTVNEALKEYIMKRKQKSILSLFGKVDIEPSYNYKKERKGR